MAENIIRSKGEINVEVFMDEQGVPSSFEAYNEVRGAEYYHEEGSIQIEDKTVVDYDGCFDLPPLVKEILNELNIEHD